MAWPYWLRTVKNDDAGPYWLIQRRPGGGQPELGIEGVEGLEDARVVVGIDDGDGLAGAIQRQAR